MSKYLTLIICLLSVPTYAQTIYVPGGTSGIASTSTGNVGVSVSAPATKLHIGGALSIDGSGGGVIGPGSRIMLTTGTNTVIEENWGINLMGNDASPVKIRNTSLLVGYQSGGGQQWGTGGNLFVLGNFGLGTTSPQSKLDVNGNIQISGFSLPMGLMTESASAPLLNMSLNFREPNKNNGSMGIGFRLDSRGSIFPAFQWLTRAAGSTSEDMVMSLTADGKLGLGTSSPLGQLELYGSADLVMHALDQDAGDLVFMKNDQTQMGRVWTTSGGQMHLSSGDNVADITINETGNVGIGTTIPTRKFHVAGAGEVVGRIESTNGEYASLEFASNNKAWQWSKRPATEADAFQLFYNNGTSWGSPQFTVTTSGNVGIGTSSPNQKLTVNGTIYGKEVKVDLSVPGPDYVFEKEYALPSLESIQAYVDQHKHLPEVPSAKDMEANGINLSEMNMLLLKKMEEMTLYVIQQQEEIAKMKAIVMEQNGRIIKLEGRR